MTTFESIHEDELLGSLSMFDRLIFKGHLLGFFPEGAFRRYLWKQGVPLKAFKQYAPQVTAEIKEHVIGLAKEADRPYIYLPSATTKVSGLSKEDKARELARRDGIQEGLVCMFGVVEPCRSFDVKFNEGTQKRRHPGRLAIPSRLWIRSGWI